MLLLASNTKTFAKTTTIFVFLLFVGNLFSQSAGYWNKHFGTDLGGSSLQFDRPDLIVPGGQLAIGLGVGFFFDFTRIKETPSKDIPIWGINFKINCENISFKGYEWVKNFAYILTVPIALKMRLVETGSYYAIYSEQNTLYTRYHPKNDFNIFLFAGPQYNNIIGQDFPSELKNFTFSNGIKGEISGIGGLEINMGNGCSLEFAYHKPLQSLYYNNNPVFISGYTLKLCFAWSNIYDHMR